MKLRKLMNHLSDDKETSISLSIVFFYYFLTSFGILQWNSSFFETYRPDLIIHFLFGYGLNRFWRHLYKPGKGLDWRINDAIFGAYSSIFVHFGKEIFDLVTYGLFDPVDIIAALTGLLIEDIKFFLSKGN